tara:strand:- start:2963 stop:4141 length:1179 start_codon:yes stop_codon:yes gene_type:complete
MQDLRGEPDELFRRTPSGASTKMTFSLEVLLPREGFDDFGTQYETAAQRLRYEIQLELKEDLQGVFVSHEDCRVIKGEQDRISFGINEKISRSSRKTPFLETERDAQGNARVFRIRQDGLAESGTSKRGSPLQLPAAEAARSALSTIATSEFRHLFALKKLISGTRFLEINPTSARKASDKYEDKKLRSDASNLAACLSDIKRRSQTDARENGSLSDISADLAMLIPQVRNVKMLDDSRSGEYAFEIELRDETSFSSRVISDGTIRLLALLALIDDPDREGILCFEEPENGVHEGRIPDLIEILRGATTQQSEEGDFFQILMNTHSPAVMRSLEFQEVLFADMILSARDESSSSEVRTRMRRIAPDKTLFDDEHHLYPAKVEELLKKMASGV